MLRIKKLDIFIIKSFAMLLAGTFFVCLFIFMMQFLWRYVDELVGKGLELSVLAQFFFYSGVTLIPMSLPLAILLATLITFGNFGERSELIAMKAAGIPLTRVMRPLAVMAFVLAGLSFYFQNVIGPRATTELYALIFSMKQKSPELDIPEGVFYDQIEGYNLYVKQKNKENGMMYGVMIYDLADGFENARIIVADSGRMEMTADKKHLQLHLYSGEQFENLRSQNTRAKNVPYRRESFREKHSLIAFDANFNQMDAGYLSNQAAAKNMVTLSHSIDSMTARFDSIGRTYYQNARRTAYKKTELTPTDSMLLKKDATTAQHHSINTDSLYNVQSLSKKESLIQTALGRVQSQASDLAMKSYTTADGDKSIRRHKKEWWGKITLSLACVIFFFIGAPLGAIIRKGGLGMPVVISVTLFIIYYIIDNTGTKMAREGELQMWFGMWISTMILAPFGAWLTYKANKDSVVFNIDLYKAFFMKLLALRSKRHIFRKEVIIEDPDYKQIHTRLDYLCDKCNDYATQKRFDRLPNYLHIFTAQGKDSVIQGISDEMESIIENLSNTKDARLLDATNNYPFLSANAHKSPSDHRWLNLLVGLCLPVGIVIYLRIWKFSHRLNKDLKDIVKISRTIQQRIEEMESEKQKTYRDTNSVSNGADN